MEVLNFNLMVGLLVRQPRKFRAQHQLRPREIILNLVSVVI